MTDPTNDPVYLATIPKVRIPTDPVKAELLEALKKARGYVKSMHEFGSATAYMALQEIDEAITKAEAEAT